MRTIGMLFLLCVTGLVWCMISGCGGDSDGQTDLAKLPPPSQASIDQAKAKSIAIPRPKFAAPAKSERAAAKSLQP